MAAYPGRAIRRNDPRTAAVVELQRRLVAVGCGPLGDDGAFGDDTESAVKLFQTRRGLDADGVVGPMTWNDLFEETPVVVAQPATSLFGAVLEVARAQLGVRETKGQPNRGPQVDQYISRVGLDPSKGAFSWCQSFVYWCFDEAARGLGVPNPCFRTAGVLAHWKNSSPATHLSAEDAFDDPSRIRPGAIFIVDHGAGKGHTGIVTRVEGGEIRTIEGNTNERGSREGDGVYEKTRPISSINIGFIDYGR
jgi:hypothetical protein